MSEETQAALDAIEAAHGATDTLALLENIPEVAMEGRQVTVPEGWPRALREKVRILRTLQDMVGSSDFGKARRKPKYAKVHVKKEAWVQALEVLKKEFGALIDIYIETTQKAGQSLDLNLINEIRGHLDDRLGSLACEYLEAYYQGWDLKPEEKQRLAAAWKLIGAYIDKLMKNAG